MSGFFAIRRTVYERAAPLNPVGYKIALELLVKCNCSMIREVPIRLRSGSSAKASCRYANGLIICGI
jgi:dolichol-phosphate mannosyltransferase